jgi:hypothetical protein
MLHSFVRSWNFVDGLTYMKAAKVLLPPDSWETEYSLTLDVNLQLATGKYISYYSGAYR